MKVTGETFSSIKKEKEPKRKDIKSIKTLRQKDRYQRGLWSCKRGAFFFYIPEFHAREKSKMCPHFTKIVFFWSIFLLFLFI